MEAVESAPKRKASWVTAALLLLAAAAALAYSYGKTFAPPDYSDAVFRPYAVTLADRVHLLGEVAPGAAYAIETSEGLVLVDTGLEADAGQIGRQLADLGLSIGDLKFVLLTHGHGDHVLGAQRLREVTGAKIHAGVADVAALESGGPREAFFSTYYMPKVVTHATTVDVKLNGGEVLDLGDATIECIATPGHTPGSMCYLLQRNDETILFTGDTITSLTGEIGTYGTYHSPRYGASAIDYLATFNKLLALPPPDVVLPGHPQNDRSGQSPRLTAAQWESLLAHGKQAMERLVARYEADGGDFLDGTAKVIAPGLLYLGEFGDWAMYGLVMDDHLYLFDAPGGDGLADFVKQRLDKLNVAVPEHCTVLLTAIDLPATWGLTDLVREFGASVVTATPDDQRLRESCPDDTRFVPLTTFLEDPPLPIQLVEVAGIGSQPVAYLATWNDDDILFSGRIPIRISDRSILQLESDLTGQFGDPQGYLMSLRSLRRIDPNIWLPARPSDGQNANLYESDWSDIIRANLSEFGQ